MGEETAIKSGDSRFHRLLRPAAALDQRDAGKPEIPTMKTRQKKACRPVETGGKSLPMNPTQEQFMLKRSASQKSALRQQPRTTIRINHVPAASRQLSLALLASAALGFTGCAAHKKSAGVQVQAALDQLFSDTFKAMTSSPDLRRLANKP